MNNRDNVEFYDGERMIVRVQTSIVPTVNSKINVLKKTWTVTGVTYAIDNADECLSERIMRACVDLTS